MASHRKVVDRDRGWKKFRANAHTLTKEPGVTVGVHAAEGSKAEKGRGHAATATVLDVGWWNEFGLGVPERSFIRAWFDEAKGENLALAQTMLRRILEGSISIDDALNQMGALFAGRIQQRIAQGIPPPNSPLTIALKGSSTPLIESGQLRQSVTWKVQK